MTPTEEQLKEIETQAMDKYPMYPIIFASINWQDAIESLRIAYSNGATAQLSKYPCTPEECKRAIELLRQAKSNIIERRDTGLQKEVEEFLTKISKP